MNFKTLSLIVIYVLLVCSCKGVKKSVASGVSDDIPKEEAPQQTEIVVQEIPKEEPPQVEIPVRTESVKPIDPNEKNLYAFYVIIGSFSIVDNARRQNAELIRKGFSPTILENENGLFRISVGGYNVENEARAKIAEIRANYREHRDVWLLIRK